MIFDWLVVAVVTWASYELLVWGERGLNWVVNPFASAAAFCASLGVAGMIFGLYERQTLLARSRIVVRTVLTVGLGSLLAMAVLSIGFYAASSRWIALGIIAGYVVLALPVRLVVHSIVSHSRMNVLCVGTPASVQQVAWLLHNCHRGHYRIVGYVLVDPDGDDVAPAAEHAGVKPAMDGRIADRFFHHICPCLGRLEDLGGILMLHGVEQVVIDPAITWRRDVSRAVVECLEDGLRVTDQPTFTERLLGEVPIDSIDAHWFLTADVTTGGGYDAAKRVVDVLAAAAGLLLTLPLWPVIALLIRLDSPGPVLFRQRRIGQNNRPFTILKFRTMRQDAEAAGAQWATTGDPRVTRLGRFLRKSRFDEFPQFLNILRGDMSLVGPRPERPEFVEQLAQRIPHYRQRHLIKPGLSGWAQINYRYGASVEDAYRKLCYDLYYLKHRSIDLDAAIIIRTIGTFLRGAR